MSRFRSLLFFFFLILLYIYIINTKENSFKSFFFFFLYVCTRGRGGIRTSNHYFIKCGLSRKILLNLNPKEERMKDTEQQKIKK
jgi:hypothetical protein